MVSVVFIAAVMCLFGGAMAEVPLHGVENQHAHSETLGKAIYASDQAEQKDTGYKVLTEHVTFASSNKIECELSPKSVILATPVSLFYDHASHRYNLALIENIFIHSYQCQNGNSKKFVYVAWEIDFEGDDDNDWFHQTYVEHEDVYYRVFIEGIQESEITLKDGVDVMRPNHK